MKLLIEALKDAANAKQKVNISIVERSLTVQMGEDYWYSRILIHITPNEVDQIEIEMARFIWRTIEQKQSSRIDHNTSIPEYFKE